MITTLMAFIKSILTKRVYLDDLEYFVESKNPQSTADVEYWIQYYNQHVKRYGRI
jgi:hypothetical protein